MDHDGVDNAEPWDISVDGFSLVKVALHKNELSISFNAWNGSELDIIKGECDIKGFLKWDGCLNFMTNPNCYYHLCNPEDVMIITNLFNAIGDEAVKHVSGYEGSFGTEASSNLHSDDLLVDAFADRMKAKLADSRTKGRGGWDDSAQCTPEHLRNLLHEHITKGDPVDVANFCMMLDYYGASTI